MTNTVFLMFQTQQILNIYSARRIAKHWDLPNTEIFQSKDVASGQKCVYFFISLIKYRVTILF
jgi:hypothetical protein